LPARASGGYGPALVIAGLDPAIHQSKALPKEMDARVKPGHDEAKGEARL
jgi:hypothetical protein